ncbi:penicillin-binding protein 1A [Roseinatronobacter bogoriensis]|uniref:Penicillin-binding protein 1A n=1 Tax=Roseinatronobacter bogoriensis subsp. barguzinensis TaxID=441209 RepID=A0A2K8K9T1_9RHOB|nr:MULTISPECIES: PBP1A family penicillin-binding protein [Rhodobaca]ATX66197.1 penicillin-binding protein [Rhodobaca barguzinensis]MBB4207303.1 penicillin-binding protein 1A [Rhodobaca bogoriensis DSM 18756]
MLRAILSFFGGLVSFAITALFVGALAVAGVFWYYGQDLPSHEQLANYAPPSISRIYSGEGRLIDEFALERRLFTPIDDIPEEVRDAFIAAEDRNFYVHTGFDARAIAVAAYEAVASRGENVRGASTITQQVMKNFLLSGDRTGERKIKELILASRVEGTLTKDQILELYLNEIFLGQNSYGVTAAAQTYFNKTLDELDLQEAAFLAALPQAPSSYHPVRNHDRVVARRNYVLGEMLRNGFISQAEHDAARASPLLTVQSGDIAAARSSMPPRDYFTDEVRRQLSSSFGEDEFFAGGLSIRATIDPEMQVHAAHALQRALEQYDRGLGRLRTTGETIAPDLLDSEDAWRNALAGMELARDVTLGNRWYPAVVLEVSAEEARLGIEAVADDYHAPHVVERADISWARGSLSDNLDVGDVVYVRRVTSDSDGSHVRWSLRQIPEVQGGFMAMDVNTGRVIAMQGGFSYQASVFNRATQAQRQPGSAYKPFIYAAALDSGFTPATIIVDAPIELETPQGIWRPTNATNQFYGPTPVRRGIELSRNLMTVRLAQEIGMDVVGGYAERFGVYDRAQQFLAASLGSQETTLFRMVAAYAMFANGGERVEPTLVDRVQDRWGETVYRHDQRNCVDCEERALPEGRSPWIASRRARVMDAVTAYQLTSMMEGVVQRGTAARTVNLPVPAAGKTGTTNEARDVWFVGYTSNIVAGCYIGYDQPRPLGRGAGGGTMCGPVFNEFMLEAIKKYGGGRFRVPEGGYFLKIDRNSGARLADDATGPNVISEFFREGVEPIFGLAAVIDGGFSLGSDLPVFAPGESYEALQRDDEGRGTAPSGPASLGSVSTGGLY